MATRADCGRTLARSYGHIDALLAGTEVGLLVDKTPKTMAAVRIVISSMARQRVAAKTSSIDAFETRLARSTREL
jgi:hypothetical protein